MRPWTPKGAIARSRQRIAGAVEKLNLVALEWADIDQGFVDEAEALIGELEAFAENIEESVKERLAAGEHVGL